MKTHALILTAALLCTAESLHAQAFNSGSTGADGALNVTADTALTMPPNGVFNFTTITVASGKTLSFTKNSLNTPVYLLATGDVTISGTINVSGTNGSGGVPGQGGPGGFDGGAGGFGIGANTTGGEGLGPGGGVSNSAPHGVFATGARKYGNALLSPLIGGSGSLGSSGNPGYGGGGGGGAILFASNTAVVVNGIVFARGGFQTSNGVCGSGGAIRIVAPVVGGSGGLYADVLYANVPGRIRIDCPDRSSFRTLQYYGVATHGSQMFVFPSVQPRLSIIEAAGQTIAEGTQSAVQVDLPVGSSPNRTVTVRSRDFTGVVPIRVTVFPENGSSTAYDTQLDMANGNPTDITVNVVIPVGGISRIQVWTR